MFRQPAALVTSSGRQIKDGKRQSNNRDRSKRAKRKQKAHKVILCMCKGVLALARIANTLTSTLHLRCPKEILRLLSVSETNAPAENMWVVPRFLRVLGRNMENMK